MARLEWLGWESCDKCGRDAMYRLLDKRGLQVGVYCIGHASLALHEFERAEEPELAAQRRDE